MSISWSWDEGSVYDVRAFVKWQDRRFRRAIADAHPELTPERRALVRPPGTLSQRAPLRQDQALEIIGRIAAEHGVHPGEIYGRARSLKVATARNHCCYCLHEDGGLSLPQIGRILDGRDHTTILNSVRRHRALLLNDRLKETL